MENHEKHIEALSASVRVQLLGELEKFFGADKKRIMHARSVLRFAEELMEKEENNGIDRHIVISAAILHDVGIKIAEQKYNSSAGHLQEIEGPPVAREILLRTGMKKEDIEEICQIIAHHHSPGKINTQNFKVLYDADCLENMREALAGETLTSDETMNNLFLTVSGKRIAGDIFLNKSSPQAN